MLRFLYRNEDIEISSRFLSFFRIYTSSSARKWIWIKRHVYDWKDHSIRFIYAWWPLTNSHIFFAWYVWKKEYKLSTNASHSCNIFVVQSSTKEQQLENEVCDFSYIFCIPCNIFIFILMYCVWNLDRLTCIKFAIHS